MDFFLATLIWMAILFVAFSAFLWTLGFRYRREQNSMLYYPQEPADSREVCENPVAAGVPNSENVSIQTPDGVTLRGYMLWPFPPPPPTMHSTSDVDGANVHVLSGSSISTSPVVDKQAGAPSSSLAREGASFTGRSSTVSTPSFQTPEFVLVYFHGNAGNVGHRIGIAHAFVKHLNCAVLMMDYRGFGLSSDADITQEGLEMDSQAVLDYVYHDSRLPRGRIVVMGTSLGGAVVLHLASKPQNARRISAVIAENTFTSISDMVTAVGEPIVRRIAFSCPSVAFCLFDHYIKPLVLRIKWRSIKHVRSIPVPILFLSGLRDELVPPHHMRTLYDVARKSETTTAIRQLVDFENGMHNNMPLMPGYFKAIEQFLGAVEESKAVSIV